MIKKLSILTATAATAAISLAMFASSSNAQDQIKIVGSSTVYPFVTAAAEKFGRSSSFKTPIVESTGTGGGFKLFCQSNDAKTPDFTNASRAIKKTERELCAKNGVSDITEIKIGNDGIVLANSKKAEQFQLTKKQIFLALAKKVPQNGKLVDNFYQKWSDINSDLPAKKIAVYGPPPTSGTRDAFVELVMHKSCNEFPEFKAKYTNKKSYKSACGLLREDGKYIEAGENDNLIVRKLQSNESSLGIFGFSFLDQNIATVQGSIIEGAQPTFENISSGKYSISRPLFVYSKNSHIKTTKGFKKFASELISENAAGEDGYMAEKGLIPLAQDEFLKVQKAVKNIGQ